MEINKLLMLLTMDRPLFWELHGWGSGMEPTGSVWVILMGIWLVISTPLKNISWDYDIPNMMGKIEFMFQTTN
jgi:hypothetical protein